MAGMVKRIVSTTVALAMAATVTVTGAGAASATPDNEWLSFPGGIAPGGTFGQVNDEGTKMAACTLGFMLADSSNKIWGLTAGHCDKAAGWKRTLFYTTSQDPSTAKPLGKYSFSQQRVERNRIPFETDVALIDFDSNARMYSSRIAGRYRVSKIVKSEELRVGTEMCKFGQRTEETCGPITSVEDGSVTAQLESKTGDSGSPGYVKLGNDEVAAVGVLSGSPVDDDSKTRFYYLSPVLKTLGMSLVVGNS